MADVRATGVDVAGFRGVLRSPGDGGYDDARKLFNAMIDRTPATIATCADADDVVTMVNVARDQGLALSVHGGGHGVTGSAMCDGGVCVDLRAMRAISVDPAARTARVEGGVTWGELDAATQEHGLAVTGGRVSTTGVGGLALGSGSGWLERKYGYTCDSLIGAEVVTADGRRVTASEIEHPDLFWGLRGGGGNFGIVTAFHFRLHPVGPVVLGGMLVYPADAAADLLRFFREFMSDAPDEIGAGVAFITAPPEEFVPDEVQGQPVVGVMACYVGDVAAGEAELAPLREFGPPAVDMVQPMPYVALQQLLDPANPKGLQNYWTADFLEELPDEAIGTLVPRATQPVSPLTQILVIPGGGALARVDENATAFGQRSAPFNVHFLSLWVDPADTAENVAYTRELSASMKPWSTGGTYLNFIGDEGLARVEAAYGPERFVRLRAIKDAWDPMNLFHHNQNIPPTRAAPNLGPAPA